MIYGYLKRVYEELIKKRMFYEYIKVYMKNIILYIVVYIIVYYFYYYFSFFFFFFKKKKKKKLKGIIKINFFNLMMN